MESHPGTADSAIAPAAVTPPTVPSLSRVRAGHRTLIANLFLGGMIVSGFLMAAGAAAKHYGPTLHIHHGLPTSIRGPLHGLGLALSGTEFAALFIVLGVCYPGVLLFGHSVRFRVGIGAIVALHLVFLVAPPLLSSDIFNYVGYARLDAVHHLNPYIHPLSAAPTDPSYIYVGWPLNTPAYGPLFTLGSLPLGWVSFTAGIWLLKLSATVASLACVALVWLCAARLGRPAMPAALFFGLNPVLLAYAVGGGHNDLLMLVAALGGIYMLLAGRESGMAAIVVAVAVKSSSVVVLPFALLGSRRPLKAIIWGVAAAAIIGAATLIAFGTHFSS